MSKAWVMVVLALAVIAVGVFLAFRGAHYLEDPEFFDRDGAEASPDPEVEPGTEDPASGSRTRERRPTLFGRAHVRIGVGDAIGRLMDFVTKEPVAGATLLLSGTGYGGEKVAIAAVSGKDGRFQLQSIPAGQDLELVVVVGDASARTLTGLVVATQRVEDLGTIWLGDAGTLEGRVLGMNGKGIRGADVHVLQGKFSQGMMMEDVFGFLSKLDRDPVPVARGESDAAGRFRIEGVPPGPITVVARVPNHHHAIKTTAMTKDGAVGGPIELRVTKAEPLVGRVVTEDGRGFAGARIAFLDQEDDESGFLGRRFVETSSDGSFRVDSPPPARELVAIVAAEGYPTLFSEVSSDRSELEFTLVGGSRVTLRFVHDDSGDPIPNASIVAMLTESESMGNSGTFLTGLTDASGQIELAARPGFVNMLMFQHAEHGSSMYSPQFAAFGGGADMALKGPAKLEIQAGDNAAEFRKPRGVVVQGIVADEVGRPVEGATVTSSGGMFGIGMGTKALTDETGAYRLVAPAMEPLMVVVQASGFVQDSKTRKAPFVAGAVEIEHHVTLLQAARVEGKVVGRAGGPAAGIEVRLRVVKGKEEEQRGVWVPEVTGSAGSTETAVTDTQGRFSIEDVAPGSEYYLIGRGEGYVVTNSERFPVEKGGHTVRAPLLKLEQGVAVKVEVRDPYGDVVSGAFVDVKIEPTKKLYWNENWRWRPYAKLMTNASGVVEAKDLPDGKVTFTARADGSAPARTEMEVSAASPPTAPVVVRLRPAITVSGTVVDQHGDAVKDGNISVNLAPGFRSQGVGETPDWVPHQSTWTDRHGRFEIRGVPAGVSISASFHAEGYRRKSITIEDRPDGLQFVVHKIDPEAFERQQVLQGELMTLYGRMQSVEDESEREALMREIQEIQEEIRNLSGEQGAIRELVEEPIVEDR